MKVYQCFCDETRLRILNLLVEGPLCVCHLTEIIGVAQPKVSRHLKALREAGALETERCYNWTIYHLPETPSPIMKTNLECLRDAREEEPVFQADLKTRAAIVERIASGSSEDLPEQIRVLANTCC
ncbi:MAG: metalloregulator ArsR/SmtB family transcription factor [Opitutales bacterium]